jgi:lipopolysaccharide export system permease protein
MAPLPRHTAYILKALCAPFLVVAAALAGIVLLTQSLRFVDLIINRGLDVDMFLYLTALLLPSMLTVILPVAGFLTTALVYNRFINDGEFIALSACGLSHLRLARPGILLALGICALLYAVTLYALPASYRSFKDMQYLIRNRYASMLLQEGVFNAPAKDVTLYIDAFDPSGELEGIFVYDARNPELPAAMMAKKGSLIQTDGGPRFVLLHGNRQEIDKKRGVSNVLYFDEYRLDIASYAAQAGRTWREPEEYYVTEMLSLIRRPNVPEKLRRRLAGELHFRFVWPAFAFFLSITPLIALLTGEFNRRGKWKRILASCIAGGVMAVVQIGLKSVVAGAPPLYWLPYAYLALLAGISAASLGRYEAYVGPLRRLSASWRPPLPARNAENGA